MRERQIGKYEVLTLLSAGGMAEVYLGASRGPGGFRKYVVIKRILRGTSKDELAIKMFLDEARITAGFSHPNIAQTFDLEEDDEGLFVVMEFIPGQDLGQVMRSCAAEALTLPLGFTLSCAHDAALALHYAHTFRKPTGEQVTVVHRDVAQKNIMVSYDGQLKLLDFGIAKAKGSLVRTKAGTTKGTTGYMSPEQVRGEDIDPRSDVFALGIVMWEMVTGKRLFSGANEMEEMRMVLEKKVPRPSEFFDHVPQAVEEVILTALAKNRDERWPSAKEMARVLQSKCGDLFYDSEQRAEFMSDLFAQKISAVRSLVEAAEASDEAVVEAVERFKRSSAGDVPALSPPRPRKPKSSAPRPPPKPKPPPEQTVSLVPSTDQLEVPRTTDVKTPAKPVGAYVVIGVLTIAVAVFVWQTMEPPTRPVQPLPAAIPGSPVAEEEQVAPLVVIDAGAGVAAVGTPAVPTKKATGDLTLVLLPEAHVVEAGKELGRGSMMSLSMTVGTHALTITGPDGKARSLQVRVAAGKNAPLKLNVEELPLQ